MAGSADDIASASLQEVTGTEQAAAGAGGELLNAFNVATFKNEEDDTAFWNRLIPATERAAPEEEPQELGIRAARLKVYDEVGMDVYICCILHKLSSNFRLARCTDVLKRAATAAIVDCKAHCRLRACPATWTEDDCR